MTDYALYKDFKPDEYEYENYWKKRRTGNASAPGPAPPSGTMAAVHSDSINWIAPVVVHALWFRLSTYEWAWRHSTEQTPPSVAMKLRCVCRTLRDSVASYRMWAIDVQLCDTIGSHRLLACSMEQLRIRRFVADVQRWARAHSTPLTIAGGFAARQWAHANCEPRPMNWTPADIDIFLNWSVDLPTNYIYQLQDIFLAFYRREQPRGDTVRCVSTTDDYVYPEADTDNAGGEGGRLDVETEEWLSSCQSVTDMVACLRRAPPEPIPKLHMMDVVRLIGAPRREITINVILTKATTADYPRHILQTFDLVPCQVALSVDEATGRWIFHPLNSDVTNCIMERRLELTTNSMSPRRLRKTLRRCIKYVNYGFELVNPTA